MIQSPTSRIASMATTLFALCGATAVYIAGKSSMLACVTHRKYGGSMPVIFIFFTVILRPFRRGLIANCRAIHIQNPLALSGFLVKS